MAFKVINSFYNRHSGEFANPGEMFESKDSAYAEQLVKAGFLEEKPQAVRIFKAKEEKKEAKKEVNVSDS